MAKEKKKYRKHRYKKKQIKPNLFTAYNYKIFILGVLLVFIGFGSMYLESKQFGFISLYVSPLMVMAGYATVAIAVFKTDPALKNKEPQNASLTTDSSKK